ncbi:hypothetical protein [Rubinisphaera sp.]|uniref:hypothetical protein n=1 Tax=Rubinisphaera sp. TaxID=2024857 RepID=UPI000C0C67AC|nr:hypothetical protein [Rubinisphaera sp.]MBV12291.1 hypothetical protein [Rubinisphaera sp.]HCS52037.1 hypothetical protein [Planctomycetaceae bacterium]|tara:strand:+ start:3768 stop:4577 length:810 start_codon:yes stop_codon:yes gene_type:complete
MIKINVEVNDLENVADPRRLSDEILRKIERHLQWIDTHENYSYELTLFVEQCVIEANRGVAKMSLKGVLNDQQIDKSFHSLEKGFKYKPHLPTRSLQLNAFTNLFTWIKRLIFPSGIELALAKRRLSGRAANAIEEGIREVCATLDRLLERPLSNGKEQWNYYYGLAWKCSVVALVATSAISIFRVLVVQSNAHLVWGVFASTLAAFGLTLGWGLTTLPDQFYLSEPKGRKLAKLVGAKTPTGIRSVALFMILLSATGMMLGIYWLIFE